MKEIFSLMLCFLIVGCATVEPIPSEQKQHIYTTNFDTAWTTIIEMLTQESCPLKTIEKESGLIHTDYIPTQYMINKARYTLSFFVSTVDKDKIRVVINPSYEIYCPGQIGTIQNGEWVTNNTRDKSLIDKYFKILDEKLKK